MKSFKISTYNISSTRLTGKQKVTFAILADLHGLVFGKNHQTLYKAIYFNKATEDTFFYKRGS